MKTLGAAKISIIAEATGMAKGVRDAKRQVGILESTLGNARKAITGLAGAYVGMKGISAIRDQMLAIDDVAKKSRGLGLTTEELIGLRHAAKLSGVDIGTVDSSMAKMRESVFNATNGLGEARNALLQIGLDASDLNSQKPEQVFYKIADALDSVGDGAKRAKLAKNIFGKGNGAILGMTAGGSETAKAAKAEAEKLGMLYSSADAANVEAANEAIEKFTKSIEAIATELIIVLAPTIQDMADTLVDTIALLRKAGILGGEKEGESRGNMSYAAEAFWQYQKALLTLPGDTAKAFMEGKLDLMNIKGAMGVNNEALKRGRDILSGKAMVDDDAAAAVKAKARESKAKEDSSRLIEDDASQELYKIQAQIDKIRLGEDAVFAMQKKALGWSDELIRQNISKQHELLDLKNQEAEATKKAAEAEAKKQKIIADQKAILQEQRDFARSIFEEGQTEYERGLLRQKEIMDAYNRGDIDGRDAQMALKANTSNVMDSMRSNAQGESSTTEFYTKGSAAAYNAIVNALGQKDKQAEIAQNTKLMYAEAQKSSRSLEQLVAKRESYNAEITVEDNI